jgi:hypothetical protein
MGFDANQARRTTALGDRARFDVGKDLRDQFVDGAWEATIIMASVTGGGSVVLDGEVLRVTVNPLVGGTITAVEHKGLGASVLGTTPWEPEVARATSSTGLDEKTWLTL